MIAIEKMRGLPVSVGGGLAFVRGMDSTSLSSRTEVSTDVLGLRSELVDILLGLLLISQ